MRLHHVRIRGPCASALSCSRSRTSFSDHGPFSSLMSNVFGAPVIRRWLLVAAGGGWIAACGTASHSGSDGASGGNAGKPAIAGSGNPGNAAGTGQVAAGAPGSAGVPPAAGSGSGAVTGVGGSASVGGSTSASGGSAATSGGSVGAAGASGAGTTGGGNTGGTGFYRMERLSRGLIAVSTSGGVYVGWRMFGFEYDATTPANVSYNVYRDGAKVANVTNSTNYQDKDGKSASTYTVRPVIGGVEGAVSETAKVRAEQYLSVPLQVPPAGTTPASCPTASEAYTYSANDASPGDADGDGVYEIFLKWDPSNAKDNSQAGCTGNVFMDAYKVDGTRLWRIDLGPNIRAGAHYTQFIVYDFDGDGKAEMAVKTAPGTKDGTGQFLHLGPAASDNDSTLYRDATGRILSGPEYLTVFNGQTGAELATVSFD